ncbi:MAG: nuclear transport factor 2 family protein [Cyanobacteria bacterium P01_A01_bin.116]
MESSTPKDKVVSLLNSFNTGDTSPIAYINPNKYIQHNLAVADGLAGFGEVVQAAPPGGFSANVVRALQDGKYVITHTEYDFFGPKIGFDVFRFEEGFIVEHWDNLQTTATETVSGRSMIDGPRKIEDLDKTESNKNLVKNLLKEVFFNGNVDKLPSYFSPSQYAQHNAAIGDGLDALMQGMAAMAEAGKPMTYTKNHAIFGQGNFALAVSEGEFMGKATAFYDLFRVQEGLIVEHWDTLEAIPSRDQWKNNNGKFGFGSDVIKAGDS